MNLIGYCQQCHAEVTVTHEGATSAQKHCQLAEDEKPHVGVIMLARMIQTVQEDKHG